MERKTITVTEEEYQMIMKVRQLLAEQGIGTLTIDEMVANSVVNLEDIPALNRALTKIRAGDFTIGAILGLGLFFLLQALLEEGS